MSDMFCFQCEQAAHGTGCDTSGVCGKKPETALLQDQLTGALITLACAIESGKARPTADTQRLFLEGLFTTVTNVNFDDASITKLIGRVHDECTKLCGSPAPADFVLANLWLENEDIQTLKTLILLGLRGISAYAFHALELSYTDDEVMAFFPKGLAAVGNADATQDDLLPLALETGKINYATMELLDRANTETYGTPEPTEVSMQIEPGPFIVISGHDLHDLKLLLEQTTGTGVSVYTHGEMLPAHAYPELKKYPQFKGNFGTAWQNQQKEFVDLPAPVLFTTNCIMPVRDSYADRIYTTAVVQYPGMVHIGADKDFSPVIAKARELGGYTETYQGHGINGGTKLLTGFGHDTVLGVADTVVGAVKSGAIKHFFLVGGCDGAKPGRNYYTEFVKQTPADTVVLTLACGKFRFNDLDLGEIGGLPRLMDMGQCNDAYSAIRVAVALSEAFECGVNDLPLTLVISWYEQKAVAILLTLLYLGIKDIILGPSLPAFVSPNILNFLVENFGIAPISTPEEDLARALA